MFPVKRQAVWSKGKAFQTQHALKMAESLTGGAGGQPCSRWSAFPFFPVLSRYFLFWQNSQQTAVCHYTYIYCGRAGPGSEGGRCHSLVHHQCEKTMKMSCSGRDAVVRGQASQPGRLEKGVCSGPVGWLRYRRAGRRGGDRFPGRFCLSAPAVVCWCAARAGCIIFSAGRIRLRRRAPPGADSSRSVWPCRGSWPC